jgi:hypothetical protein
MTFNRDKLIAEYVDTIVDDMDTKTLMQFAIETLTENLADYTDEQLHNEIYEYYPHLLEETTE